MRNIFLIFSLIFFAVLHLFGGDTARFVNLGFSGDGKYFMFAQHGFISDAGKAYSDLYIVNVSRNIFVPDGVIQGEFETAIEPGQPSDGALYALLEDSISQKRRYGISYLEKGRPLFIRVMSNKGEDMSRKLQFRDFETGDRYIIELHKTVIGTKKNVKSGFYIDLSIEAKNGTVENFTIGHPQYLREKIAEYSINRILLSPEEKSLVFVISKIDVDFNTRYMIETVKIK